MWSRLRHKQVSKWESKLPDRFFFWGASSEASCDKPAWIHNTLAAVAPQLGFASFSAFVDLRKFYDMVSHQEL
eukprot:7679994-Pyramimonas_sp.AAC.1